MALTLFKDLYSAVAEPATNSFKNLKNIIKIPLTTTD